MEQEKKLCLSCQSTTSHQTTNTNIGPTWLTRLGRTSAMPPKFQEASTEPRNVYPSNADVEIVATLDISKVSYPVHVICWWGAVAPNDDKKIYDPATAYGVHLDHDYPNAGFAKVDPEGKVVIRCCTPQIYFENEQTWPRHLHFVYANESRWDLSQVYTMAAFPVHEPTYLVRPLRYTHMFLDDKRFDDLKDKRITVNALPLNYPMIDTAFDRFHLPSKDKVSHEIIEKIGNRPYIVYCEHVECNAAVQLIQQLVARGCPNVFYYPGGRQAYDAYKADCLIKQLLRLA
jgi:hypothetical protein